MYGCVRVSVYEKKVSGSTYIELVGDPTDVY